LIRIPSFPKAARTNRTLSYDDNGSLVNDGLTHTFEWDGANRLTAVNYTGTTNRSEFTYDGLSRCVKIVEKTNGSVTSTRKFVWCGDEKCEFRDANDAVTLMAYSQGQYVGTTKYFYFRDHLGSIREMMKSNGTLVARFDYDPWGRSMYSHFEIARGVTVKAGIVEIRHNGVEHGCRRRGAKLDRAS
jgi:YD repeat-containing protein